MGLLEYEPDALPSNWETEHVEAVVGHEVLHLANTIRAVGLSDGRVCLGDVAVSLECRHQIRSAEDNTRLTLVSQPKSNPAMSERVEHVRQL